MYVFINVALAELYTSAFTFFRAPSSERHHTHVVARSPTYRGENLACREQGLRFISLDG